MKKITPLLSWTFKSFLSLMIILFISNRTIAQTGTVATDKADYFPAKKNAFWIALLAFFMLALQPFSVGAQTFCALDPIPSTQLNLRLNSKYERGKCPAGDIIIKGASIDVGGHVTLVFPELQSREGLKLQLTTRQILRTVSLAYLQL